MDIDILLCQILRMDELMPDIASRLEAEIPRLRRYARALTQRAAQADDLVQGCLVRAMAKQHLWQEGTDLRAWLFTILHNQHVNHVRRAMREGLNIPVENMASTLTAVSGLPSSAQARSAATPPPALLTR